MKLWRRSAAIGPPDPGVLVHASLDCQVCQDHLLWHRKVANGRRYRYGKPCSACTVHLRVSHQGRP